MTLRYLAGASYLDLAIIFGVCDKTFTTLITPVLLAIHSALSISFLIDDIHKLEELERGFYDVSGKRLPGCVAAGKCVVTSGVVHD